LAAPKANRRGIESGCGLKCAGAVDGWPNREWMGILSRRLAGRAVRAVCRRSSLACLSCTKDRCVWLIAIPPGYGKLRKWGRAGGEVRIVEWPVQGHRGKPRDVHFGREL
jgi:hypothetical protein